ncbi:MAG: amidase [Chloroflexota bacterium]
MQEIIYATAVELRRAIRRGDVSAVEVVQAHLDHIDAVNPQLNAVVQVRRDAALEEARAADERQRRNEALPVLHGVPVTIKDNIFVKDMVVSFGTRGLAGRVADQDGITAARVRAAGGIVIGMTNMPEMGLALETDNDVYGRTNNPWDLERSPGGSSGGEAAIIAAGGSPLGFGNDIGGSIRYPAHCTGITGIKPTSGRVPRTYLAGAPTFTSVMSQNGPLARSVDDLFLALQVIAGPDGRSAGIPPVRLRNPDDVLFKGVRVAYFTDNGLMTPAPACALAVTEAARALAEGGIETVEARPPGTETAHELYLRLMGADGAVTIRAGLAQLGTTTPSALFERSADQLSRYAQSMPEFLGTVLQWNRYKNAVRTWMTDNHIDALLCPVSPHPALPHGMSFDDTLLNMFSYTTLFNLLGYPVVSLRAGTAEGGLPVGLQIAAAPWREDMALALARLVERALGGFTPPVM